MRNWRSEAQAQEITCKEKDMEELVGSFVGIAQ